MQRQEARRLGGRGPLLGAMFLMATSAIGPGFITQTTQFTAQLGAAFAFAILVSVLVDVALQLNVWRVIGVSGLRAQELGNRVAARRRSRARVLRRARRASCSTSATSRAPGSGSTHCSGCLRSGAARSPR